MQAKAVLINSAENRLLSPDESAFDPDTGEQKCIADPKNSLWNNCYGWGYLDMTQAYKEYHHVIQGEIEYDDTHYYRLVQPVQGDQGHDAIKVTVVMGKTLS